MSLAIPYRDQSRTPLALTLSVLLHGAIAAGFAAFILIHAGPKPPARISFELVSGPPSAETATGTSTASGPMITTPNLPKQDTTPVAPPSTPQVPPPPVQQPQLPRTPPVVPPKPNAKPIVAARGSVPAQAKPSNTISIKDWQQRQGTAAQVPNRNQPRPIPRVGVDASSIVDNLNKYGTGSPSRSGNTGNRTNRGNNGSNDDYYARLIQRVRESFVAPPAINGLVAIIHLEIAPDGTVTAKRLVVPSTDERFNNAVRDALTRLNHVDPTPDGQPISKDFRYEPAAL